MKKFGGGKILFDFYFYAWEYAKVKTARIVNNEKERDYLENLVRNTVDMGSLHKLRKAVRTSTEISSENREYFYALIDLRMKRITC